MKRGKMDQRDLERDGYSAPAETLLRRLRSQLEIARASGRVKQLPTRDRKATFIRLGVHDIFSGGRSRVTQPVRPPRGLARHRRDESPLAGDGRGSSVILPYAQ